MGQRAQNRSVIHWRGERPLNALPLVRAASKSVGRLRDAGAVPIVALFNVSGDVALTVLGAVTVAGLTALITARTTNRRLERQLEAEGERVVAQLQAEQTRHDAQLQHERELSDLAELRDLLDETTQI